MQIFRRQRATGLCKGLGFYIICSGKTPLQENVNREIFHRPDGDGIEGAGDLDNDLADNGGALGKGWL